MLWIPITIAAAALQTARNAFQRSLTGALSPLGATYTRFLFGFPFAALYAASIFLATGAPVPALERAFVGWCTLGGVAQILGTAFLLQIFQLRNFSTGIVFSKSEILQVALFGMVVLGDRVTALAGVAILVATIGLLLLSRNAGAPTWRGAFAGLGGRPTLLGLGTGAAFAIAAVAFRAASLSLDRLSFVAAAAATLAVTTCLQTLLMAAYLGWREPGQVGAVVRLWRRSLLPGLTGAAASACWFTAMTLQIAAYVRMLGLLEVLFGYGVTVFGLRQRPTAREIIGTALLVLAIVALLWDRGPHAPRQEGIAMQILRVDVAVIGAGTAGLNARRQVEKEGRSVVMIESGPYGTLCARVGCMPSKLLIAAADAAHEVAGAGRFGIRVPDGVVVDGPALLDRVRRERDRFVGFVVRDTEAIPEVQRLRGRARFVGPSALEVNRVDGQGGVTRVEARAIVVATGSAPFVPPPFDANHEHVMVSDDVFELADLPRSLAVVGTGIIGLELGQALSRLGVRVAFFNPSASLGPFTDPEVQRVTREVLEEELALHLESEILEARPDGGGVRMRWRAADGGEREDAFERVLVAAGRRPRLADLDLARAGVPLDARGQPPWNPTTAQIPGAPVFLAGDASGHLPLLHEASDEGRIAGANAATYPAVTAHERRAHLAIAFTDPQMAVVGTPYGALDLDSVEIGEVSYADQGRARMAARNQGLVRLYAYRQGCRLVGAEMFGPRVEHMAHLLAWAVQEGMTVQHILRMPFYHPVFEEGLRTGLRELAAKLRVTGECRGEDLSEAPGA